MSEKRQEEAKLNQDNKSYNNNEFFNIQEKSNENKEEEIEKIIFKEHKKEDINFDSIDFNINPFNNESKNNELKKEEPFLEKEDYISEESKDIVNQKGQKFQSSDNLFNFKLFSENKIGKNIKINDINDKVDSSSNSLIKNIYKDTTNIFNNIKINSSYDNYYNNIRNNFNPFFPIPNINSRANSNPFLESFINNNQLNNNNPINYSNNNNQINYINNNANNQINYINNSNNNQFNCNNNYYSMNNMNWICSYCNNYNNFGKNLLFIFLI